VFEDLSNLIWVLTLIVIGVVSIGSFLLIASRFYQRCGADVALVRTGSGGNKVVIGGGIMVYPVLHQLQRVPLRSVKLSVERSSKNALITGDKIKANITTELYIKVEPIAEDVLAAARSFGERNMDEHSIGELIEGKLTDALRSVAANQSFMSLHGKRKDFAEHIQAALAEELKKNGLTLENVSITALSMVSVKELDANDVFDAEGLRAITESVQTNKEKTNQIQQEKDLLIHQQNVEARKRHLELEQQQKEAEADQVRRVSEYTALQSTETAKAVFIQEQARSLADLEKQRQIETARIAQEQSLAISLAEKQRAEKEAQIAAQQRQQAAEIAKQQVIEAATIEKQKVVQAAEIDRQKALEAATIEKEKVVGASLIAKEQAVEVARISKEIAITQSQEEQARAAAAKALAVAEEERAQQTITTVEETAKAERAKAIAVIQAQAEAEVKRSLAEGEAQKARALADAAHAKAKGDALVAQAAAEAEAAKVRIAAEARLMAATKEAEAIKALTEAQAEQGRVLAENREKMIAAENAMGMKFVMRDVALKLLEVAPELTRELMSPVNSISEIKLLQTNGMAGNDGAPLGAASPIVKTILEAGAAYPLMKELLQFAESKPEVSVKVQGVLDELQQEVKGMLDEKGA
jgi:uncharacterized membrane protein YqiK